MPCLIIDTNLSKDTVPPDFHTKASSLLAQQLGKPEKFMMVQVNTGLAMTFGGLTDPCANVTLNCVGVVGPEKNRELAPLLSKFIGESLNLQQDRFYITFNDIPRPSCAWNGKTFG